MSADLIRRIEALESTIDLHRKMHRDPQCEACSGTDHYCASCPSPNWSEEETQTIEEIFCAILECQAEVITAIQQAHGIAMVPANTPQDQHEKHVADAQIQLYIAQRQGQLANLYATLNIAPDVDKLAAIVVTFYEGIVERYPEAAAALHAGITMGQSAVLNNDENAKNTPPPEPPDWVDEVLADDGHHTHAFDNGVCTCGAKRSEMFGNITPVYAPCPKCGAEGEAGFQRANWSTAKCRGCGHVVVAQ